MNNRIKIFLKNVENLKLYFNFDIKENAKIIDYKIIVINNKRYIQFGQEVKMKNLSDEIIKYIEENKTKHDIDYFDTIESIKELIKEIENDYNNLEG